ncbi:putative PEP-binding protein [Asanoa sp. NPDC049573]|uniref:putative PEP-binding protein n=1 Tax=Asanoa sp. NPDC049573 TaxID=3155396 RepID=UPI003422B627
MTRWSGQGVAPGAAVAGSWRADRPLPAGVVDIGEAEVEAAFAAVAADLDQVADRVRAQGRTAAADIVGVGALIAADPDLLDSAKQAAGTDRPLPAVRDAIEAYATILDSLPDDALRQRAADVRQVGRRVLERLAYPGGGRGAPAGDRFVLVAGELGPADLIEHLGAGLVGAVAVRGGANSHAAIVARSVGLPLVMGVDPEVLDLPDATDLLVDADAGAVVAEPSPAEVERTEAASARAVERRALLAAERGLPHVTADGQAFGLYCNVASDVEVRLGLDMGAVGVGLVRTEIPFMTAERWPDEAEHRRALAPLLAEASGKQVTARLLDFANDKIPPFLAGGPAGLPVLLDHPDALAAQVRAMLATGRDVDLRIMVPMVTSVGEMAPVRAAAQAAAADLDLPVPPVGAMVETIAAVDILDALGQAVDFFSIGSNDLTAEVLDLSRVDPRARTELAAHPRVLEMIGRVVAAADRAGLSLTVCGDAGSHPTTLPLLVGAGVRSVSVAVARVDETRWRLRRLDTGQCRTLFEDALRLADAGEVAALVNERIEVAVP